MNKKGQEPKSIGGLILWACGVIVAIILMGVIVQTINNALNPSIKCNYSSYENNISLLQEELKNCRNQTINLSDKLKNRPIKYIPNMTYVPEYKDLPKTEIIYSYIFVGFSVFFIFFFSFKFHLFKIDHLLKIEIKEIPDEWKKELERLKGEVDTIIKSVKVAKWLIITFIILLVIKLTILIFSTKL